MWKCFEIIKMQLTAIRGFHHARIHTETSAQICGHSVFQGVLRDGIQEGFKIVAVEKLTGVRAENGIKGKGKDSAESV